MKIFAIATLAVFLCCLEVVLSYPSFVVKPRYPQAKVQEISSLRMAGKLPGISTAYLSDAHTQQDEGMFMHCFIMS